MLTEKEQTILKRMQHRLALIRITVGIQGILLGAQVANVWWRPNKWSWLGLGSILVCSSAAFYFYRKARRSYRETADLIKLVGEARTAEPGSNLWWSKTEQLEAMVMDAVKNKSVKVERSSEEEA
jgi:hypothetical protein